ncbi:hypothetical protein H072_10405 [Dactylellina haptotyla CBS 200.50]|uniref:DUF3074 domain-containing protein n=1 Tax=Dactylellina haptotyla (strain CBS 200.50) TaxID=1284197 RepID=S8A028_DACHA|nr:hypothetical protein H072_10405 [Dactylellina haptotyla CBS 200.50]
MAPADLYKALANLSPIDGSTLPDDEPSLEPFLDTTFENAAIIIDTLPIPPPPPKPLPTTVRSRAGTVSSIASGTSNNSSSTSSRLTITPSPVRPNAPDDASVFTKDWKEIKPGGANPHDIKVYKLAAKDGNGAWFARRSVHEGIGFARFRKGLRREFEESLGRRMGQSRENVGTDEDWAGMVIPAGVRGIGAERRLERKVAKGVGRIDVYHLSAQFPGPSAPRDFVTACITSSTHAPPRTSVLSRSGRQGREFTMVSRPINHSSAPEQSGFVRGKYESIEFIREIIPEDEEEAAPRRSMSVSDLTQRASVMLSVDSNPRAGRPRSRTVGEPPRKVVSFDDAGAKASGIGAEALKAHKSSRLRETVSVDELPDNEEEKTPTQTVPMINEPGNDDEDMDSLEEDGETNPVEWIMLTRSDPGGSVPRFMVERGTPGSIVKDAEKFLDWACEKVHEDDISDDEHEPEDLLQPDEDSSHRDISSSTNESSFTLSSGSTAGLESSGSMESPEAEALRRAMSHDDSASNLSFMTADSGEDCEDEVSSSMDSSQTSGQMMNEMNMSGITRSDTTLSSIAMQRVQTDAVKAAQRVQTTREKNDKKIATRLAKEEEKQRKLEEKHSREAAKREEKFKREQARAEEKRRREEEKIRDRKRRLEERDEKIRHEREKEDLKHEIELLRKEKDVLFRENEMLRRETAGLKAKYEPNGGLKSSRSSSSMALSNHVQRPASPASSSSSSRGKKKLSI